MIKALFFTVVGIAFLGATAISIVTTVHFLNASAVAPGTVVRLNAGGSHPEIEFSTAAGERISYAQGGLVFGAKTGDRVQVRYRADRPSRSATLDRFGAIWTVPIFLAFFGLAFTFGGLVNMPRRGSNKLRR